MDALKRTLVAARLTQVLLIKRDSQKNQAQHCTRFRVPSPLLTHFLLADAKYFPSVKFRSRIRNVAYIIKSTRMIQRCVPSKSLVFSKPPQV
jgi:hypothetical protein